MRYPLLTALALVLAVPAAAQGAKESMPISTPVDALKPGEWVWYDAVAPEGPSMLIVDLSTQRAQLYRNGVRIGVTTVSTGKKGKATPTGIFTILQKKKEHYSNLYNSAPMPYMQRLTWDGIALHAGNLPGYPASHGCIRMPLAFAQKLYGATSLGMTVIIADEKTDTAYIRDAGMFLPVDPADSTDLENMRYRWQPEKSPEGPVTILVSRADSQIVVLRNGKEIGRSKVRFPEGAIGTHAITLAAVESGIERWQYIELPGSGDVSGAPFDRAQFASIGMPRQFRLDVRSVLVPGTTIYGTDDPIVKSKTGRTLTVIKDSGQDE